MLIKRKLYSVIDEEGNLGYYLYDESNGEEKLFSIVEEEKEFARGVGSAVKVATQMASSKGYGTVNKALGRESLIKSTRRNLKPKYTNLPDHRVLKLARSTNKPIVPQKGNFNAPMGLHEKITQRGNYISDFQRNSGVLSNHPLMKDHPRMISDPTFNLVKLR